MHVETLIGASAFCGAGSGIASRTAARASRAAATWAREPSRVFTGRADHMR